MNNKFRFYLWALAAAVFSPTLGFSQPSSKQPHPVYKPSNGLIESVEIASNGRLVIGWDEWENEKYVDCWRTEWEPKTKKVVAQQRMPKVWRNWKRGQKAVSRQGWTALLPPPDGNKGDRVFGGHGDSSDDYSVNWLRLIAPTGKVQVLKQLPQFFLLNDLRFSADGNEVVALTGRSLWRYNLHTKWARCVVRPNSGASAGLEGNLADDWAAPQNRQQVWVNDKGTGYQTGAVLSPDAHLVIGYHSNIDYYTYESELGQLDRKRFYSDLLAFDTKTGRIVRRIPMPFKPRTQSFTSRPFRVRFTADGKYLLVEGPNWDKVICLSWSDGKKVGVFDWESQPYQQTILRQEPVLSSDGRSFCDSDGSDIVIKSVLNGKVIKRAKGALQKQEEIQSQPYSRRLPSPLAIAPDLSALYFQPMKGNLLDSRLWKWPLISSD